MIAIGPLVFSRPDVTTTDRLRKVLALQFCAQPGCSAIVIRGKCRAHQPRSNRLARLWYFSRAWAQLRAQVLLEQAYACAQCGTVDALLQVDHVRKHDGDSALFWDRSNLQGLCAACHRAKTKEGA